MIYSSQSVVSMEIVPVSSGQTAPAVSLMVTAGQAPFEQFMVGQEPTKVGKTTVIGSPGVNDGREPLYHEVVIAPVMDMLPDLLIVQAGKVPPLRVNTPLPAGHSPGIMVQVGNVKLGSVPASNDPVQSNDKPDASNVGSVKLGSVPRVVTVPCVNDGRYPASNDPVQSNDKPDASNVGSVKLGSVPRVVTVPCVNDGRSPASNDPVQSNDKPDASHVGNVGRVPRVVTVPGMYVPTVVTVPGVHVGKTPGAYSARSPGSKVGNAPPLRVKVAAAADKDMVMAPVISPHDPGVTEPAVTVQ
jgi:hypothetical protein